MSLLIVNTTSVPDERVERAIEILSKKQPECEVIHTRELEIKPCIGCNHCWIKTPGICTIKDDHEEIIKAYLRHDEIIYIAEAALGFVDYRAKNVIDRVLPLATMYTKYKDGQARHVGRYEKKWKFGLLYKGESDEAYLNEWINRVAVNFVSDSIGAYPIEKVQEVVKCI